MAHAIIASEDDMIAITYSTCYGSAGEYAALLGRTLGLEAIESSSYVPAGESMVIHFGGLYAGSMRGLKDVALRMPDSAELVAVSVGVADPTLPDNASRIDADIRRCLPQSMLPRTTIFRLRGRLLYSRLSPKHRAMMWMLCRFIERKKARREEDDLILSTYGTDIDFFDPASIAPISEYVRSRTPNAP